MLAERVQRNCQEKNQTWKFAVENNKKKFQNVQNEIIRSWNLFNFPSLTKTSQVSGFRGGAPKPILQIVSWKLQSLDEITY